MMKKLLLLAAAATMICAAASGQDQPKKKGGFWNKVKKGVESTTGLDVSKETLFVYPEMGKWKMEFISATGDSATGLVLVRIGIMPLAGQKAAFLQLTGVIDGDGQALPEGKSWKATEQVPHLRSGQLPAFPRESDRRDFLAIPVPADPRDRGYQVFQDPQIQPRNGQCRGGGFRGPRRAHHLGRACPNTPGKRRVTFNPK